MTLPLARFEHWLHAPAPAERLAAMRIAIGAFVTIYLAGNVGEVHRLAGRDTRGFDPVGIMWWLDAPVSSAVLWSGYLILLMSGVAFTFGLIVRASGPVFAFLVLSWTSYHSSWGQLLHFEHLMTLHVMILALAPTADAWAIGHAEPAAPSVRYGWPIKLLAVTTALTYVLSGIAKLRLSGWSWFDPDTLAAHIGYSATRMQTLGGPTPPLAEVALSQQWLLPVAAVATLVVELGAPLALVSHRLRNAWVALAVGFHAAAGLTMWVFFGYRGLGIALLPLFAVEQVPARFGNYSARRTRLRQHV